MHIQQSHLVRRRLAVHVFCPLLSCLTLITGCESHSSETNSTQQSVPQSGGAELSLRGFVAEIDPQFDTAQVALLEEALTIVNERIFAPRVGANLLRLSDRWAEEVHPDIWNKYASLPARKQLVTSPNDLLAKQLAGLADSGHRIRIRHFLANNKRWGEAVVGRVFCRKGIDQKLRLEGTFEIAINARHLASGDDWRTTSARVWAVVIAHELLHNLGHHHTATDPLRQMIAFERCLYYDGNYSEQIDCPEFECGARQPELSSGT